MNKPENTTIKLSNPLYIGVIAPLIRDYFEKAYSQSAKKGIASETRYSQFVSVVQNLGSVAEFRIAMKDDKPVGFASWNVLGFPYFGSVYCSSIYNNSKDHEVTKELVTKFIEFAEGKKCPYVIFETQNEAVSRFCRKAMKELNVIVEPTGITQFIGRI